MDNKNNECSLTDLQLISETYNEAQERILQAIFPTYPNVEYKSLRISINCTTPECFKKIHKCIDRLPASFSKIINDSITIEITTINSLLANGVAGLTNSSWAKPERFYQAFNSWKGTKRRWRVENKLVYFSFDTWIKDEDALYRTIDRICIDIDNGRYADEERATFQKPINKWKSEEHVLNIAKQLYGNYQVLYQHRPFFLKTEKGQLSYDIYICGIRVAIEYQGKQHYEPVDFFGGEEHFLSQKERDAEKKRLSKENGIALVYINYWESISPMLIRQKVEEALQERDHQ